MSAFYTNILAAVDTTNQSYQVGYFIGQIIGAIIAIVLLLGVPTLFIISIVKYIKHRSGGWLAVLIITALPLIVLVGAFGYGVYTGFTRAMNNHEAEVQVEGTSRVVPIAGSPLMLKMPDHWKMLDIAGDEVQLQMGNLRSEEYLIAFSYEKEEIADDFKEFIETIYDTVMEDSDNMTEINYRTFEVNGLQVAEVEFEANEDDLIIRYLIYMIEGQDHYYDIRTWTLGNKTEKAYPVFRELIGSIQEEPIDG